MTIDELKQAHDSIPPTTPENRAKRAAIMRKIRELMNQKAGE